MDRRAYPPGVASSLSDQEVLDRAAIDADLPGILRAYGWRAVRGEDAHERRVLTDSEGSRRVVVSRDPENQQWRWWDAAVNVVGTIVDAVKQLLGLRLMRDVVTLLRNALNYPPGPLPVSEVIDQPETPSLAHTSSVNEQTLPSEEPSDQQTLHVSEPDDAVDDMISETLVEGGDEPVGGDVEPVGEQLPGSEDVNEVEASEDSSVKPPRRHRRGR